MMYTLDLSGHDNAGKPGVERMGGLFMSIKDAEAQGRLTAQTGRFVFNPATIWIRDQENLVVAEIPLNHRDNTETRYLVTITSADGSRHDFRCAGPNDQSALIYGGKLVEANAAAFSQLDYVDVTKNGMKIGPMTTVGEMITRAV